MIHLPFSLKFGKWGKKPIDPGPLTNTDDVGSGVMAAPGGRRGTMWFFRRILCIRLEAVDNEADISASLTCWNFPFFSFNFVTMLCLCCVRSGFRPRKHSLRVWKSIMLAGVSRCAEVLLKTHSFVATNMTWDVQTSTQDVLQIGPTVPLKWACLKMLKSSLELPSLTRQSSRLSRRHHPILGIKTQ